MRTPHDSLASAYRRRAGNSMGRCGREGLGRRVLGLSSFSPRGVLFALAVLLCLSGGVWSVWRWSEVRVKLGIGGTGKSVEEVGDDGGVIPVGQSRDRGGREVFWWEQFEALTGYYAGVKDLVVKTSWVSEQDSRTVKAKGEKLKEMVSKSESMKLVDITPATGVVPCYIDKNKGILPPRVLAYDGIPQGLPAPLFGSHHELGLRDDVCYDRVNRLGPYGYGVPERESGLRVKVKGTVDESDIVPIINYSDVRWGEAQDQCVKANTHTGPRTAFVIRTWDSFEYTSYHILMLRSIISELALASGGKYTVHFLIHVQNDSIPIWASDEVYDQVLKASLPTEFAGMGSLWSVAQMKLIYPPPFPESIVNFSGDELYKAYRSLHFPLQYFADKHPEFEYFWHWEMDMRVTGGYLVLFEQISSWAQAQDSSGLWEASSSFFIPSLFEGSYVAYKQIAQEQALLNQKHLISGPQLPVNERLTIPNITDTALSGNYLDLITFSPLFNPDRTSWAFHDDITGYPPDSRPPTRAALITASRLSRRLLVTMHHETFQHKHTMFPEMFLLVSHYTMGIKPCMHRFRYILIEIGQQLTQTKCSTTRWSLNKIERAVWITDEAISTVKEEEFSDQASMYSEEPLGTPTHSSQVTSGDAG